MQVEKAGAGMSFAGDDRLDREATQLQHEPEKQPAAAAVPEGLPTSRSVALILVLSSASFLNACVIVLPVIGRDVAIPAARQQWIISASSLTFACTLLTWGRIADVCGRPMVFRLGFYLVALSCLLTPFAPEEISFDFFRALQGLGGAACTPTAIGIIATTYPPGRTKIYAISAFSAGFPLGNVIGSILGGVIAQYLSWRWIFWILCIFASTVTALSYVVLPKKASDAAGQKPGWSLGSLKSVWQDFNSRMDWIGAFLITAALLLTLVALTEGNVIGWKAGWIVALLVLGPLLLCLFCVWELIRERQKQSPPLMKLSIFKNHTFSAAQIIMFLFWAAFNNFLVFATFFYQNYLDLSVIETTLRLLPSGITGLITVFVASQILARVKGNYIVIWSTLCVSIACLLFAVPIPPETTYWAYGFPAMIVLTFGGDTLLPCLQLFVTKTVSAEDQAIGAATLQTVGQVGRTVGLAIATAIQVAVTQSHVGSNGNVESLAGDNVKPALLLGYRAAEYFSFAAGILGMIVAIFAFQGAGKVGA